MQEESPGALTYQRSIESGDRIIVGVNKFRFSGTEDTGFRIDDSIREFKHKSSRIQDNRDPAKCDNLLQQLNDCASGDDNIMPVVLEAVEQKCTLGESQTPCGKSGANTGSCTSWVFNRVYKYEI